MKIILIGLGKIGFAIASQMVGEAHDLTIVDKNTAALEKSGNALDAMCVEGNGAGASVLLNAGVREADLVIAVTADDEVNLVCALMAKKLGAKHTVARVRNPEYFRDAAILRREIGLDMIINPDYAAAQEIARILRVPAAFGVESFARGAVELIGFTVRENDGIVGKTLIEYNNSHPNNVLLCAARRGDEVTVPNGSFIPQVGDKVYAIGTPSETMRVFRSMGRDVTPIRSLSMLGGGRISLYLAWALETLGTHISIVEREEEKCLMLAEKLPKASIIHGDATDRDLLESENIYSSDALVTLTGRDEENLLMALTAKDSGVPKTIAKVSRPNYSTLVQNLGIDAVISPKDVAAAVISRYVRALANSQGSAVERLYKLLGGEMEAVEFTASAATHLLDTPLRELRFKPGTLVAAIIHEGRAIIPTGTSRISEGDRVIVVAKSLFLQDLNDILER
ncbi:MAG: Trk system potassium transporter TrkA [Oscillospiraceae bacterium]|nr:Trk system potassium transporter TrkA [Oscillospiraceae bacterium]